MWKDSITSTRPVRPPQDNIPQTKKQRDMLLNAVCEYVRRKKPVGPLSMQELRRHSDNVIKLTNAEPKYANFVAVLLNNEVWRPTVATIPYHKRLLLLPKCLRHPNYCRADLDEFGLVD